MASINIENIITDPSEFKKKYNSCCYCGSVFGTLGYFHTRKLAEDFVEAYKTYGEKWYIEDKIAQEEDRIKDYEKKIEEIMKTIAEDKARLEEIINELSKC